MNWHLVAAALSLLLPLSIAAIETSDTQISTTRNSNRNNICSYFQASYQSSDKSTSQSYINQYDYLTDQQIEDMLYRQDFSSLSTETLLLVMTHAVTFGIFCILWIPLCCCCVWPEKNPSCKNCRKPQKEMYKAFELKWTAYCSVIFYLIVTVGSLLAAINASDIVKYYNDVGCKGAALADDIINGRLSPTVDDRFFVGLSALSTALTTYQTDFSTFWTQNENSLERAVDVRANQTFFQLSTNSTYSSYTDLTYVNAFSDGTVSGYANVNSVFKDLHYGDIDDTSSILGNIYYKTGVIFQEINLALDPMIAAWSNLSATTNDTVSSQVTTTLSSISSLQTSLETFLTDWGDSMSNDQTYNSVITGLQAFYGTFFALSFLGTIAAVILACCSVVRVRLVMYFTCGFMYFLGFMSFVLLIVMAVAGPSMAQTCKYIDKQLSNGSSTVTFMKNMGWDQYGQFFSNCMNDGDGWVMYQIEPTFNQTFADQRLILNTAQQFNDLIPSYSTANLTEPFTTGTATVNKVMNAQLLQVNDTFSTFFIDGVRLISYSIDVSCDVTNVNADAWMPSYTLYACPAGKAKNSPCGDLSSTTTCPLGCYEIMQQFRSAAGDSSYATTLASRYGSVSCNYYIFVRNLQDNWNVPRKAGMQVVNTEISTLEGYVDNYDTAFKATQANITSYKSIVENNYDSITNLTAGTFNGLDCRVIAQSLQDFRDSFCVGFLNSIYYNFIVLLLISYGTLLVACCATCAGVRHFKHLQRMQVHVGYKGVPIQISDKRLNQTLSQLNEKA